MQNFGSQLLSSQFQIAMQPQYNRTHQSAYVGAGGTGGGKQDHNPHLSRPQQLKSPLQVFDHQNSMFGGGNIGAQVMGNQGNFGGGAPSPKNNNSNQKGGGGGFVGGPTGGPQNLGNKQGSQQQHSPPHHKYQSQPPPPQQQYQPMHPV